jgi:chromosome segregation ATPase
MDDFLRLMKTFDESRGGSSRAREGNGLAEARPPKVKDATPTAPANRNRSYHEDLARTLNLVREASDLIKNSEDERARQEAELNEVIRSTREQLDSAEARARESEAEARVLERRVQELELGLRAAEMRAQSAEIRAGEAEDWLDRLRETIAEEFGHYKLREQPNVH